jgi:hypothetical protein
MVSKFTCSLPYDHSYRVSIHCSQNCKTFPFQVHNRGPESQGQNLTAFMIIINRFPVIIAILLLAEPYLPDAGRVGAKT